jgi:hypothetical protein
LREHGPGSPRRSEIEGYIRRVYAARYGADVQSFAPILVSLVDGERIVAAAGYRPAATGPLFLERYLGAPVETLLPAHAGLRPSRRLIVEVGHLASDRFGEGMRLVRLLGSELAERRFEWVVSTATQELRRVFMRLKVVPQALGAADPAALGDDAARWGSYYEHRPVVLASRLAPALELLLRGRPERKRS